MDFVAPAIVAGEPFGNQVNEAALEFELRQVLFTRTPNAVTVQELTASRVRYVAVETNHAQITHGMGTADLMAAIQALGTQLGNLQKQVTGIKTDFEDFVLELEEQDLGNQLAGIGVRLNNHITNLEEQNLGNQLADLQAKSANQGTILGNVENQVLLTNERLNVLDNRVCRLVDVLVDAKMHNQRARDHNRDNNIFTPLVVENRGVNTIGAVPALHPQSEAAVLEMTEAQVNELELQFNLPVGHFGGGNIVGRRARVIRYLTHG
jgi:hypothetical protein